MTTEELLTLEQLFRPIISSSGDEEQSDVLVVMLHVAFIEYWRTKMKMEIGGTDIGLLCEMCVSEAPRRHFCLQMGLNIIAYGELIIQNGNLSDKQAELVYYLLDVIPILKRFSPQGEFDEGQYYAENPKDLMFTKLRDAVRELRRVLDRRRNVVLSSLLAHRLDLICHCPFGLRPRY